MVARAQAFTSDISVLIDPETIVLPDFVSTLNYSYKVDHDWLLVASSRNVSNFPFYLSDDGKNWQRKDGKRFQEMLDQSPHWNLCEGRLLMAWNSVALPLYTGVLPPFLYGKGVHDPLVISEALSNEFKFVFDASWTISSFSVVDPKHRSNLSSRGTIGSDGGERSWEYVGNSHLGSLYGSSFFHGINYATLITELKIKLLSYDQLQSLAPLDFPFSLESLLSVIADKNKTVVLAVAGYSYRDMLMSWGLPVFSDPSTPSNTSFDDCDFGTKYFQRVSKVKSRMVLQILKLGYNVLLSDVDVYWFKNPLPLLYSFGPSVLTAQSDEYNATGPINLPWTLNSGFYFARCDASTIAAMEKVVKHAATSNLSEQPNFYDTLCGEGGSNRVGDNRCMEPETNLTIHFLDRNLFPNGAYSGLWQKKNVKRACEKKGCFVLHNNWFTGRLRKLECQVLSGLREYDISTRMCMHSWHRTKSAIFT
ncbi:hypothetical protein EZV62_017550 [Acer yangbiense]|uniref:Nucleotide-diphospho-sugar transferase domain-containing protein n=1 Tax=Acer yangbiense TaxID=1000413 RepID=A0A5C7HGV1_9ROSI|nr:hypothetical protein EZV62_017550 [Acer yangbiense]